MAPQARAVQITGAINFTGSGSATQTGSGAGQSTAIHFNNPFSVIGGVGSYTGTTGSSATFTDFTFTGNGTFNNATLVGSPILNEWSFTFNGRTYSFDLFAVDPANSQANASSISLQGTGILRITDGASLGGVHFDPTSGSFALSGAGSNFQFTFLNASSSALPEGGSALALLGVSLLGLEIFRRRLVRA